MNSQNDPSDAWLYWYRDKEDKIEQELPAFANLLEKGNTVNVLDLGCGTGRHSIFLAKRGFQVSGFDQSSKAIERAKELAKKQKVSVNLRVWNMLDIPYAYNDSCFSALVSTKVIHHTTAARIRKIAQEITRLTKRGGYLFLQVPTADKLKRIESETPKQDYKQIEERSILFLKGEEAGITHHYFTEQELYSTFRDYKVLDLKIREEHFCLTAVKQ